jgi:hypothetical protein
LRAFFDSLRATRAFLPGRVAAMSGPAAYVLLEAVIAAASVLGGLMAFFSGWRASQARASGASPASLQEAINVGIAVGFDRGLGLAILALLIVIENYA